MNEKIEKIRKAVCTNRGGLEKANDEQIMIIWNSLPSDVQKQYLESIKERKGKDATGDTSKCDV